MSAKCNGYRIRKNIRIVGAAVAEAASRDLVQYAGQSRALLLDRLWVVHVLVTQVLHGRREVSEEDWMEMSAHEIRRFVS